MLLPITAYGHPVLKKVAEEIDKDYPGLEQLIADMFETMYESDGIGLAAPQVNRSIRLFIVDGTPYADKIPETADFKKIFINPYILSTTGSDVVLDEGCLSIPNIREDVTRKDEITIEYYDEKWELKEETYTGFPARVIQHEYDHLEGILFVERISSLRKTLLRRKLHDIAHGNVDVDYRMIFPNLKKSKLVKQ
ncbi:MAG: peptide deformylase [Bacteroidales bacterium]|jgi:peptide deformylase|nr:peptide deformylase [Bacteroidales bacterium]NCU34518.1 peptide deformylase [Candidatus Falkowbacteria bacterium]MDD2631673.1 peptide deformylase [Bacteroidales bacterium]MDD3528052.1 peptide deformylase [Bacteroidales bacterium]MDD4176420.1 peptide deformylase [Bacteroidales bacterium]